MPLFFLTSKDTFTLIVRRYHTRRLTQHILTPLHRAARATRKSLTTSQPLFGDLASSSRGNLGPFQQQKVPSLPTLHRPPEPSESSRPGCCDTACPPGKYGSSGGVSSSLLGGFLPPTLVWIGDSGASCHMTYDSSLNVRRAVPPSVPTKRK